MVTALSGGVFDLLDPVLERYSFDEFGEFVNGGVKSGQMAA